MQTAPDQRGRLRTRWAAIGAAVAITLGSGGIGFVSASVSSGERAVLIPITSCRIIDVRPDFQVGPKSTPLGPNETMTVSAHGDNGNCSGIPDDAVALSLNVTALDATSPTFLTIWANGVTRPIASSLNPAPGAPPTPNAVTTELSEDGQFNVFNRAGLASVFIDVNGYYVDHDHDDRYDTSDEVDVKIAAQAALGPTEVDIGLLDMQPTDEASFWAPGIGYQHFPSLNEECLRFAFDAMAEQQVTGARVVYTNQSLAPVDVRLRLIGTRTTPGPNTTPETGFIRVLLEETQTLPVTTDGFDEMTWSPTATNTLRDGDRSGGFICTSDEVAIVGIQVRLANP